MVKVRAGMGWDGGRRRVGLGLMGRRAQECRVGG